MSYNSWKWEYNILHEKKTKQIQSNLIQIMTGCERQIKKKTIFENSYGSVNVKWMRERQRGGERETD